MAPAFRPSPVDPHHVEFVLGLQNLLPVAVPLRRIGTRFADDLGEWDAEDACSMQDQALHDANTASSTK